MIFAVENQIFVIICCVAIGVVSGIFFSLSLFFKQFFKSRLASILCDVVAFIFSSILYIVISVSAGFPSTRAYMVFGYFVGLVLYFKSFNLMLAKSAKKLYNIIKKKTREIRYARIKSKTNNNSHNRRSSASSGYFAVRDDISVNGGGKL